MAQISRRIKIFLLNLLYRRLWVKIAIVLLILVTIPVVLLGVMLIHTSQEAVKNSVLNNHKEIVIRAAEEIGSFIKKPQYVLNIVAGMFAVTHADAWKQETILVELALDQPLFIRVSSLNLAGQEIASSELGGKLNWSYPKEALKEALKGRDYISQVNVLGSHTPYVTMAAPVKESGRTTGVLIAEVNLRGLWGIVDNIKLDKTGRAFLVDQNGLLITHQDKKRVLKNENIKDQKDVQSVLSGKTESIELEDKTGKKWISSYAPVPDSAWGIVLRQEQDEAYLFSKVMQAQSWTIIILSELVVILVSIFMAQVLAHPIKVLVSRIRSVSAGNFDERIEIIRHDEIGRLIRSFNDMTKKLKKAKARERLSAIGEASAWIAHEFKNSLVAIKPFVQLFPRKHKDKEFVETFSKLVPQEIKRWESMLKDLSDFSSNFELNLVKTKVRDIINSILKPMEEEFMQKKIVVQYNSEENNLYLDADPERLRQVFVNLIINAIKAMPGGGSLIISEDSINGDAPNRPSYLEIKVKDTGVGISEEALEKLFEPFHPTRKIGGMGLGLTISRRIIEQHGGNINVESKSGVGTTFIVRLPANYPSITKSL